MSVITSHNSFVQDYSHPDDHNIRSQVAVWAKRFWTQRKLTPWDTIL